MKPLSTFLDVFIPRACAGCGIKADEETHILCKDCETGLEPATPSFRSLIYNKIINGTRIHNHFTAYRFSQNNPVRELIHALKFSQRFRLGEYLGTKLGEAVKEQLEQQSVFIEPGSIPDLVIPVPLHPARKAERGFNQAELLAHPVAERLRVPVSEKALVRHRYTKTQSHLKLEEDRRRNVRGAFSMRKQNAVEGKSVLLIDDVFTTGATIFECAKVLMKAGAGPIYSATVASVLPTISKQ